MGNPVPRDVLGPKVGANFWPSTLAQQMCGIHQCVTGSFVPGDKGDSVGCSGPPGDKGPPGDNGPSGDNLVP